MSCPQTVCCLRDTGMSAFLSAGLSDAVHRQPAPLNSLTMETHGCTQPHTAARVLRMLLCGRQQNCRTPTSDCERETATRHCFQSHPIQYLASASNRFRICFVLAMKTKMKISFSALFPLKGSTSNPSPMRTPLPSSSLDFVSTSLGACPFFLREAGGICQVRVLTSTRRRDKNS